MHRHQELFSDKSEIYLSSRPRYPAKLYQHLVALCDNHESVWDAACGNGQAAIDLANYFAEVQATDISQQQIDNAIAHTKVKYSVQPAEATNFAENNFDLVCVAQALHWFDYEKFWPEVQRVLKPKGVFAAWGYSWFKIRKDIDALIDQDFLQILQPYWARQNQLLWDGYVNVPIPFKLQTMPAIEMTMQWNIDELFTYLHSWSATRRCMDAIGDAFFVNVYEKAAKIWGEPEQKRSIAMDFCVIAGKFI